MAVAIPEPDRMEYYEDVTVGSVRELGETTFSREEILEFAERYDPQPFHLDEEAAGESIFGGLIASGWHTAAKCMRVFVEGMADGAWQGARGVDELRWIRPVRPGDTVSVTVEVLEKTPHEDHPTLGHVNSRLTGRNQNGEAVITWIGLGLIRRRTDSTE